LIGFKSGFSDENVKVRRDAQPGILRQACGVSYSQFTLPENVSLGSCTAEIDCQHDAGAELWMELLTPAASTRTLLRYQHPAGKRMPPPPSGWPGPRHVRRFPAAENLIISCLTS
jgi:beta-galactosidase